MSELRIYGPQLGVPIGSINDGLKLRGEMDGIAADFERETRRVGGSLNFDPRQDAPIDAFRRQDSRDPLEDRQIGILEFVAALDRRIGWFVGAPRSEFSAGLNVAGWF